MHIMKAVMAAGKRFLPTDISGLKLWLDASAIELSDGAAISSWTDLSGNGFDFIQSSESCRPLYKTGIINGKPVVRFDGSDDRLACYSLSGLGGNNSKTIFAVATVGTGSSEHTIFQLGESGVSGRTFILGCKRDSSQFKWGVWQWGSGYDLDDSASVSGAWAIIVGVKDGNNLSLYRNGVLRAGPTARSAANIRANNSRIGARFDNGTTGAAMFFQGDLAELVLYDSALAATDIQKINKYLSQKYGIALS